MLASPRRARKGSPSRLPPAFLGRIVVALAGVAAAAAGDAAAASAPAARAAGSSPPPSPVLDPFVRAAPLVCAAACRDGVLLLAAHARSLEEDEPLLYHRPDADAEKKADDDGSGPYFRDLPRDFEGPFRLWAVDDGAGTGLAAAGWRADGDDALAVLRGVADAEREAFGPPDAARGARLRHGRYLARALALNLAQRAATEGGRALSCACLLASPLPPAAAADASGAEGDAPRGQVWLVDATGAYPVWALALGGGTVPGSGPGAEPQQPVADLVNARLMEHDWARLPTEEALRTLLGILSDDNGGACGGGGARRPPVLARHTRLEVAVVRTGCPDMVRHRLSSSPELPLQQ